MEEVDRDGPDALGYKGYDKKKKKISLYFVQYFKMGKVFSF